MTQASWNCSKTTAPAWEKRVPHPRCSSARHLRSSVPGLPGPSWGHRSGVHTLQVSHWEFQNPGA